jgi:hypothetical protein
MTIRNARSISLSSAKGDFGKVVFPMLKMECPTVKLDTTERTREKGTQALHAEEKVSIPPPASDR